MPQPRVSLPELRGGIREGELLREPGSVPSACWGALAPLAAPQAPGHHLLGLSTALPAAVGAVGTGYSHPLPRAALGAPAAPGRPGSSASSRGCRQQTAVLCPATATHGSAARGRSWSWHGHCGDAAEGLGGLGALGLLSLPLAHDSGALAPIFSGCDATNRSPREKLFLRAALARRLPRWG